MSDHSNSLNAIDAALQAAGNAAATIRQTDAPAELDVFDQALADTVLAADALRQVLPIDPPPDPALVFTPYASGSSAPDGTPQAVVLTLHGSGTIAPEYGLRGFIEWPAELQYKDSQRTFVGIQRVPGQGHMLLRPWDNNSADPDPAQPNVPRRQSLWMGWTDTADGVDHMMPIVEERLDALLDWLPTAYPEMSQTKVVAQGGSMGGWGCASYAARRPERFAAVYASRPRVRSASPGGVFKVNDWTQTSIARPLSSDLSHGPQWGGHRVADRLDLIAYAANPANPLPWLGFTLGRQDGYAPFEDFVDLVAALRATGRGFACQWTNGNHGDAKMVSMADILRTYPFTTFELGVGYPVFSACSLDQDPAVDLVGGINLGLQFRNVVESATEWSCEVMHRDAACSVDVRPRSDVFTASVAAQTVSIAAANTWVPVTFTA